MPFPIGIISSSAIKITNIPIDYLLVAGGGGGGLADTTTRQGGGGGAGGLLQGSSVSLAPGSYPIVIGAGGNGSLGTGLGTDDPNQRIGQNSTFNGLTALGGGGGGSGGAGAGGNGGSGGGGGRNNGVAGTGSQGNNGGVGGPGGTTDPLIGGGGGGGAGSVGSAGTGTTGGAGGTGVLSSITGSSVGYAGGGGGASTGTPGTATHGGGNGGTTAGTSGTANTGGGGGGGANNGVGGNGGSGVCIIRYSGSQKALGGTISSSGGYTIHTFTASSTLSLWYADLPPALGTNIFPAGGSVTVGGGEAGSTRCALTTGTWLWRLTDAALIPNRSGQTFNIQFEVKLVSGSGTIGVDYGDGIQFGTFGPSGTWQTVTVTVIGGGSGFLDFSGNATLTFDIRNIRMFV